HALNRMPPKVAAHSRGGDAVEHSVGNSLARSAHWQRRADRRRGRRSGRERRRSQERRHCHSIPRLFTCPLNDIADFLPNAGLLTSLGVWTVKVKKPTPSHLPEYFPLCRNNH